LADLLFLDNRLYYAMASSSRTIDSPVNEVPADARSVSDESDSSNEEGWEDVEPEDDSQPVVGLFSDVVFPDMRSMLKECKEKNNFDLVKIQKDLGMSFHS
jgi:protein arginine N-methyltransferase 3